MSIDGVAKTPLQASVFTPGRIDSSIDGVAKMPLQASIFTPGRMKSRASILCTDYIIMQKRIIYIKYVSGGAKRCQKLINQVKKIGSKLLL